MLVFITIHWYNYSVRNDSNIFIINNSPLEMKNNDMTTVDYTDKDVIYVSDNINLNTATVEEIASIIYVTVENAEIVVKFREENGYFKDVNEIDNVDGITDFVKDYIKKNVYVE